MKKPTENEKIVENLERAIYVIEGVPEDQFDLHAFRRETACGTFMCTAGWLCTDRHFAEQGMMLTPLSGVPNALVLTTNNQDLDVRSDCAFGWTDKLFGEYAFDRLFEQRGDGEFDDELVGNHGDGVSDKELALARLHKQLAIYKAM